MFWVFKKEWHEKKIDEKLNSLKGSLKQSFSKIKEDILEIHDKHYKHHSEVNNKISMIIKRIENLENNIPTKFIINNQDLKPKIVLTKAQKELFEGLVKIHYISKNPKVSFQTLANEVHAGKDYNKIRSTISEYTNILEEIGLIKKIREGKRVYVSITQKGLSLIDEEKFKKGLTKLIKQ